MGVINLHKLIREFAPTAIKIYNVDQLNNWRIAVDANLFIYQWCSVGRKRNIVNSDGKFINHIQGAFFRTVKMITSGIIPIFIFDGAPPSSKARIMSQRKVLCDSGSSMRIPREVFAEIIKLLSLMGVKIIQAPSDAEAQAAFLSNAGAVDAVATEDFDVIAFGARFMIRGLNNAAKTVEVIDTAQVLSDLGLNQKQFIDLCILMGTDYVPKPLIGVGYKTALNLIKKHGTLKKVLDSRGVLMTPALIAAQNTFRKPLVNKEKITCMKSNLDVHDIAKLRNYLLNIHLLSISRIEKSLIKLENCHK